MGREVILGIAAVMISFPGLRIHAAGLAMPETYVMSSPMVSGVIEGGKYFMKCDKVIKSRDWIRIDDEHVKATGTCTGVEVTKYNGEEVNAFLGTDVTGTYYEPGFFANYYVTMPMSEQGTSAPTGYAQIYEKWETLESAGSWGGYAWYNRTNYSLASEDVQAGPLTLLIITDATPVRLSAVNNIDNKSVLKTLKSGSGPYKKIDTAVDRAPVRHPGGDIGYGAIDMNFLYYKPLSIVDVRTSCKPTDIQYEVIANVTSDMRPGPHSVEEKWTVDPPDHFAVLGNKSMLIPQCSIIAY
ncbi:hypothetical protein DSF71_13690 [Salmonella enterica subsp. enterica serovar Hvittingfoss]|nr:hypothetical protein [Salmonella enterica subsp. enterica serovar Hvittingfoss]